MVAAVKWYTQEFGYRAGAAITDDVSGNLLQQVTRGASMMGDVRYRFSYPTLGKHYLHTSCLCC